MKKLLLIFCAVVTALPPAAAHEIEMELIDVGPVDSSHIFLDGDKCLFRYPIKTEWQFEVLMDDGSMRIVRPVSPTIPRDELVVNSFWRDIYSKIDEGAEIKRISSEDGTSLYYRLNVCAYNGESWDRVELTLNLLPEVPEILDAYFVTQYDWLFDDFGIDVNGNFVAVLATKRAENVIEFASNRPHEWASTGFKWRGVGVFPTEVDVTLTPFGKNSKRAIFTWGQYVYYRTSNKYGFTDGEPVYTNDYITDPAVLARIKEICDAGGFPYSYPPLSGVETINEEGDHGVLTMRNNEIAYSGDGGDVAAITLYDATGRQVGFRPSGESSIDIHNLQKGMYIAVFNLKNNNTLKLKFIKNFTDMK